MIEARLCPNAIRRKNAKSEESSSPRVDERRCSNNEDDGKSKVGRRQDRKKLQRTPGATTAMAAKLGVSLSTRA
jgi:hypothetical protein